MLKLFDILYFTLFLCAFLWLKNPFNQRNPRLMNYLCAFDTSTLVENPLQISPFLTNKANFRKSQMNVSDYIIREYEQIDTWSNGKNKPKTKPIQSQFKPNTKPIQTQYKANTNPISEGKKMLQKALSGVIVEAVCRLKHDIAKILEREQLWLIHY